MEKAVRIAPHRVPTAPGREENPHSAPAAAGFQGRWPADRVLPDLSVAGNEDREDRLSRLRHAYGLMDSLVAVVWPGEAPAHRDPGAVSWAGAICALQEAHDELTVVWRDEDHLDKFCRVADLAWGGLCESGWPVVHLNADPAGLSPRRDEVLY